MDITLEKIEDAGLEKLMNQTCGFEDDHLCMVSPYKQVLRENYEKHHEKIQAFEVFEDDVWVTGHPKSGTHWLQETVFCIMRGLDDEEITTVPLDDRVQYFEHESAEPDADFAKNSFNRAASMKRPRLIKTHYSYEMLPKEVKTKKPKIIHIYRNPRDVCASFYNHFRLLWNYTGDLETFVDVFTRGLAPLHSPFFVNVLSYWNKRNTLSNLMILSYEEMKADLAGVIHRMAKFLEVSLTEEEVAKICDHLSFEKMKENPTLNMKPELKIVHKVHNNTQEGNFINKGKAGNWKSHFDADMIRKFEEWETKWLKDSDLKFVYEV